MTVKYSTGFVQALAGAGSAIKAASVLSDITLTDNGSSNDIINRTSGSFVTDGYEAGDFVLLAGTTNAANSGKFYNIMSLTATDITIPTGSLAASQATGSAMTVVCVRKRAVKDLMHGLCMRYYTGSVPTDADAAETGTLLVELTNNQTTFIPGNPSTGITLDDAVAGVSSKTTGQRLSGIAVADGTAGYFRVYDNKRTLGASSTAVRYQGTIGTSGADINMVSTTIATGNERTLDTFTVTVPM